MHVIVAAICYLAFWNWVTGEIYK